MAINNTAPAIPNSPMYPWFFISKDFPCGNASEQPSQFSPVQFLGVTYKVYGLCRNLSAQTQYRIALLSL